MRLPVPTALGIKAILFYAVMVAAFFAAPYANLFFLLVSFLTVLGAFGFVWSAGGLAGVEGEIMDVPAVPAGGRAEVRGRVRTGRRLRVSLSMTVRLADGEPLATPAGPVRGEAEVRGLLPARPRGLYPIDRARIESAWPLGLFRVWRPVPAPAELVVYPAPAALTEVRGGGDDVAGLLGSLATTGDRVQPSGVREYREGDELKSVHWKASARRGALVVKEWDGAGGGGPELVLDRRAEEEPFEDALSLVSAIAAAAREAKESLTLHTQGLVATHGTGHRPWDDLLRFLAGAERLPPSGPPPPPASPEVVRLPARSGGGAR